MSQGKSFLVGFCKKVPFFLKRCDPRFCTPLQRFGLILEGLGPPAGDKNKKKQLPNYHRFFDVETKAPKPFFIILNTFLGSLWDAFWSTFGAFWLTFGSFLLLFLGSVSGTAPGPFLASFWLDFAPIL